MKPNTQKLCRACNFRLAIQDSDYCDKMKCFLGNTPEGNLNYLQQLVRAYKEGGMDADLQWKQTTDTEFFNKHFTITKIKGGRDGWKWQLKSFLKGKVYNYVFLSDAFAAAEHIFREYHV